jgi:hypothetical protein
MNILAAALLLQPVEWHQKTVQDGASLAEKDSLYKPQPSVSGWVNQNLIFFENMK